MFTLKVKLGVNFVKALVDNTTNHLTELEQKAYNEFLSEFKGADFLVKSMSKVDGFCFLTDSFCEVQTVSIIED